MPYFDEELLKNVERYYPLPLPDLVGVQLQDCFSGPRKDWPLVTQLTIAAFEKTLIVTSCIVVSEYLRLRPQLDDDACQAPDARIQPLYSDAKVKLTMGAWWGLFRDVSKPLRAVADQMIIPELYAFHFNDRGKRTKVSKAIEGEVIPWRNSLVHGGTVPSGEAARPGALHGLKHLEDMLAAMSFFRQYTMIQTDVDLGSEKAGDSWETGFKALRGYRIKTKTYVTHEQAEHNKIYLAPLQGLEGETLTLGDMLCLSPFLVYEYCKDCKHHEFFYYKCRDRRRECLHYESHSTDCSLKLGKAEQAYQLLTELLKDLAKKRPDPTVIEAQPVSSTEELLTSSQERLTALLSAKSAIYDENVYVPRTRESTVSDFLASSTAVASIVTGRSGVGKTCLLCNTVSGVRDTDIVCWLDCVTLIHDDVVDLPARIARELGIGGSFDELLAQLYPPTASPDELAAAPRIVLVFDGINAYSSVRSDATTLYKRIIHLVSRVTGKVKVLATCTTNTWNALKTLQALPAHLFQLIRGEPLQLTGFDDQEVKTAYESYERAFDLKTTFAELEKRPEVLARIADPIFLKLLAETYRGAPLPTRITGLQVFKRYHSTIKQSFGEGEFQTAMLPLLERIIAEHKASVSLDPELREQMGDGYATLKSLGVLAERGDLKVTVSFRFERFLEYLLAIYHSEGSTPPHTTILGLIPESVQFPTMRGAVVHMIVRGVLEDERLIARIVKESPNAQVAGILVEALTVLQSEDPQFFDRCLRKLVRSKHPAVRRIVAQVVGAYLARAEDTEATRQLGLDLFMRLAEDSKARVRDASVHAYSEALRRNFDVGMGVFEGLTNHLLTMVRDLKSIRILNLISPRTLRVMALIETYSCLCLVTLGEHIEKAGRQDVIGENLLQFVPEVEVVFDGWFLKRLVGRIERGYRENVRYATTYREIQSSLESEVGREQTQVACRILGSDEPIIQPCNGDARLTPAMVELLESDEELVSYMVGILLAERLANAPDEDSLVELLQALMTDFMARRPATHVGEDEDEYDLDWDDYEDEDDDLEEEDPGDEEQAAEVDVFPKSDEMAWYNTCCGLAHANFATEEPNRHLLETFRDLGERYILRSRGTVSFKDEDFSYDADTVSMLSRAYLLAGDSRIDLLDSVFAAADADDDPVFYDYAISTLGELGTTIASPDVLLRNLRPEIERLVVLEEVAEAELILELHEERIEIEKRLAKDNRRLMKKREPPMTTEYRRRLVIEELLAARDDLDAGQLKDMLQKLGAVEMLVHLKTRFPEQVLVFAAGFKPSKDSFLQLVGRLDSEAPIEYVFYSDQSYHKIFSNFPSFREHTAKALAGSLDGDFRHMFSETIKAIGGWVSDEVEQPPAD